jgi:hypothetical protein
MAALKAESKPRKVTVSSRKADKADKADRPAKKVVQAKAAGGKKTAVAKKNGPQKGETKAVAQKNTPKDGRVRQTFAAGKHDSKS